MTLQEYLDSIFSALASGQSGGAFDDELDVIKVNMLFKDPDALWQ